MFYIPVISSLFYTKSEKTLCTSTLLSVFTTSWVPGILSTHATDGTLALGRNPHHTHLSGKKCYIFVLFLLKGQFLLCVGLVCACVCVFIKLYPTAPSGPAILVILCHSHWSSQAGINDDSYNVCVCVFYFPVCNFFTLEMANMLSLWKYTVCFPLGIFYPTSRTQQVD